MTQKPPSNEEILKAVKGHRDGWSVSQKPVPEETGSGEESVWDFPRPPAVQDVSKRIIIELAGHVVADTCNAIRIIETAGAPVYYLPPADCDLTCLIKTEHYSVCEWKGAATYFDLEANGELRAGAAFSYLDPIDDLNMGYRRVAGYFGFYAGKVDRATIDGEQVSPQPGGLYAGWVTKNLRGPIKGAPGTGHW
ncbi:MAG: DUF427 domain-containing protein [Pseudomonadota bacterium]